MTRNDPTGKVVGPLDEVGAFSEQPTTTDPSPVVMNCAVALMTLNGNGAHLPELVDLLRGVTFEHELAGRVFWGSVLGWDEMRQSMEARPPAHTVADLIGESVVDVAFVGSAEAFTMATTADPLTLANALAVRARADRLRLALLTGLAGLDAGRRLDRVEADLIAVAS